MSLGPFIASFTLSPAAFVYVYSVFFGVGKGLSYSTVLSAAISHLPSRKGTVSGLVVCGFGFGGSLFGIVTNRLCNPTDVSAQEVQTKKGPENLFPLSVASNVPHCFRTISLIYLCITIFALICVNKYSTLKYHS